MGFIKDNLAPNETLICLTGVHWATFLSPLSILACYFLSSILGLLIYTWVGPPITIPFYLWFISLIWSIPWLVILIRKVIFYKCTEYALTSRRVLTKKGLIKRNIVETALEKIEGVNIDQSILGRLLGYGQLTFVGTGGRGNAFRTIKSPFPFKQKVQEQVAELRGKQWTSPEKVDIQSS